jgi:hypothetical protein
MPCQWRNRSLFRPCQVGLIAILVALVGFSAYAPVLDYFFTGTDTFTLIDTCRIRSWQDVCRILLEPLMGESQFAAVASFYRPLSSFSYSLDYLLWGLDPFGYHLTDLLLHALVVALVVVVLWAFSGDLGVSAVGGLVFAAHPNLVESVTAPSLRHDVLATGFLLLSLLWFFAEDRARSDWRTMELLQPVSGAAPTDWPYTRRGYGFLSVACFGLAMGAKEIAIFFPGLVLAYVFLFNENMPLAARIARSAIRSLPYFLLTCLYLVWRIHVLGGLGGYHDQLLSLETILERAGDIAILYGADLIYTNDWLDVGSFTRKGEFVLALTMLLVLALWLCHRANGASHRHGDVPGIRQDREGGTQTQPRRLLPWEPRRIIIFLAIWTVLPLAVSIATATFNHRSMYGATIPFSALLGCALAWSAQGIFRGSPLAAGAHFLPKSHFFGGHRGASFCAGALSLILAVSLLAYSPLIRKYGEVEDCATISRALFEKLQAIVPTLPYDTTMHIYNLPSGIRLYQGQDPRAKEVGYLNDYSIKSWLNLHFPGNRIEVKVHSRMILPQPPEDLQVLVEADGNRDTRLFVAAVASENRSVALHGTNRPSVEAQRPELAVPALPGRTLTWIDPTRFAAYKRVTTPFRIPGQW